MKHINTFIGETVRLINDASEQMDGHHVQVHVHGKLEADDDDTYLVRIKEDYNGTSSVGFHKDNILDVELSPSGIVTITLR